MTPAASIRAHLHGLPVLLEVDFEFDRPAWIVHSPRFSDVNDWEIREVWLLDHDGNPVSEMIFHGLDIGDVPAFEDAVRDWLYDHENEEIAA